MSSRKFILTPYHGNEIISKADTFIELEFRTDISFDNWNDTISEDHIPELNKDFYISWVVGRGHYDWQPSTDISTNEGKIYKLSHNVNIQKNIELRVENQSSNLPFFISYDLSNALQFRNISLQDISGTSGGTRVNYDFKTQIVTGTDTASFESSKTTMPDSSIRIPIDPTYEWRIVTDLYDINEFDNSVGLNTRLNSIGDITYFRVIDQSDNIIFPTKYIQNDNVLHANGSVAPYNDDFTELRGLSRTIVSQSTNNDLSFNLGTSMAVGLDASGENIRFRYKSNVSNLLYNATINGGFVLSMGNQDNEDSSIPIQYGYDHNDPVIFKVDFNEPVPGVTEALFDDVSLNTAYNFTGAVNYFQVKDQNNNIICPLNANGDNGQIVPYSADYSEMRGLPREPFDQVNADNQSDCYGTALTIGLSNETEFIAYRFKHSNTQALYNTTISGDSTELVLGNDDRLMQIERQDFSHGNFKQYGTPLNPVTFFVNLTTPVDDSAPVVTGIDFIDIPVFKGFNNFGVAAQGNLPFDNNIMEQSTFRQFRYNNGIGNFTNSLSHDNEVLNPHQAYWIKCIADGFITLVIEDE